MLNACVTARGLLSGPLAKIKTPCFPMCVSALKHKKMQTSRSDPSFISRGFTYWKDDTVRLASHNELGIQTGSGRGH